MPADADHGGGYPKEGQDTRKPREKARVVMKQISDQEAFPFLSQAGFTSGEIHQLSWFRHSYQTSA